MVLCRIDSDIHIQGWRVSSLSLLNPRNHCEQVDRDRDLTDFQLQISKFNYKKVLCNINNV